MDALILYLVVAGIGVIFGLVFLVMSALEIYTTTNVAKRQDEYKNAVSSTKLMGLALLWPLLLVVAPLFALYVLWEYRKEQKSIDDDVY